MWLDALPPVGGTFAGSIDDLFHTITYLMGFCFVVSLLIILYLIVVGLRKPGVKAKYVTGESKAELGFVYTVLGIFVLCDLIIDVQTHAVWASVKETLPAAQIKARAIGQQWAWTFVHPGKDGEVGTEDDISTVNELHLPAGLVTHVELESSDVLHSFSIPMFRLKQDVIPGRIITSWFKSLSFAEMKAIKDAMNARANDGGALLGADTPGTASFDIQCTEMCGVGHGIMASKIILHTQEDYDNWVAQNSPVTDTAAPAEAVAADAAPAEAGAAEAAPAEAAAP